MRRRARHADAKPYRLRHVSVSAALSSGRPRSCYRALRSSPRPERRIFGTILESLEPRIRKSLEAKLIEPPTRLIELPRSGITPSTSYNSTSRQPHKWQPRGKTALGKQRMAAMTTSPTVPRGGHFVPPVVPEVDEAHSSLVRCASLQS